MNTGYNIFYHAKRIDIEKMAEMFQKQNWQDDQFSENRATKEVRLIMALMEERNWGNFEQVIGRVFHKIVKVDVS